MDSLLIECNDNQDDDGASGPNPLLIELILDNIFQYLDWNGLKECRLVCKTWHQASLPFWARLDTEIYLTPDVDDDDDYLYKLYRESYTLSKFLKEIHGDTKPFSDHEVSGIRQNKRFTLKEFTKEVHHIQLRCFWDRCGQYITCLNLADWVVSDLYAFRDVILAKHLPHLAELKMEVSFDYTQLLNHAIRADLHSGNHDCRMEHLNLKKFTYKFRKGQKKVKSTRLVIPWREFFKRYPNLEFLCLVSGSPGSMWNEEGPSEREIERILTAIKDIRENDPCKLTIKSVQFVGFWLLDEQEQAMPEFGIDPNIPIWIQHNSNLQLFKGMRLPLENLNIYVGPIYVELRVINDLLSSHSETLKTLHLQCDPEFNNFHLPFMPQLTHLTLQDFKIGNLSFLRNVPNLESLRMDLLRKSHPSVIAATSFEQMNDVVLSSLTTFISQKLDVPLSRKSIMKIHTWMPNLKHLEIGNLASSTFSLICRYWPTMEKLTIYNSNVDDRDFTGIYRNGYIAMRKPNITNLSKLRELHLLPSGKQRSDWIKLTEKSALEGFMKLPNLQQITFTDNQTSVEVITALKTEMPNLLIKVHGYASLTDWIMKEFQGTCEKFRNLLMKT